MSDFEFNSLGDGRFSLEGEMSFHSADLILRSSERLFDGNSAVTIDLSGVSRADSAGLALLLEWKSQALARNQSMQFDAVPEGLMAIARTTGVSELL